MTTSLLPLLSLLVACTSEEETADSKGTTVDEEITCADVDRANCVEIEAGDSQGLLDAANLLEDDSAIVLTEGTWTLDNAVTFRSVTGITLIGQGMGRSVLDFDAVANQVNGVDVIVDDFHIEGLTILDAAKDALRIEDSSDIVIRGVETTWTNEDDPANGAYGLYPVQVERVLMEDNVASNAADAGIYVGQCQHAIVRNNTANGNVAGLEIENTQFADVYGNTVTDNTAGLVVFDLPGNPVIGRDVHIHGNIITDNNRANFAPGGTVAQIPAGTGTFVLASRRVVITGNTYARNNSTDLAILSGFVVEGDPAQWYTPTADVVGDVSDLDLDADEGGVYNFRTSDVWVHGNTHDGSGTDPDMGSLELRPMGFLLGIVYGLEPVDTVLYDAIGESAFHVSDATLNSNDNRICVGADAGLTYASLNLEVVSQEAIPDLSMLYRPESPFEPFNCTGVDVIAPEVEGA